MDNPRAGTFCLLLAIGLGSWSVVNSLDQGRKRLTLHDPSSAAPPPPAAAVSEPRDPPEAAHAIIETLGEVTGWSSREPSRLLIGPQQLCDDTAESIELLRPAEPDGCGAWLERNSGA